MILNLDDRVGVSWSAARASRQATDPVKNLQDLAAAVGNPGT
jgi:hypothetical protein